MEFEDLRPTVLEINLENFRHNVRTIQNYIGNNNKIMPVIKANAYGTYVNKNLDVILMDRYNEVTDSRFNIIHDLTEIV